MSLLTAAQVQARGVGASLDTTTLQAIIDDEESEMIARYGAHGDGTTAVTEVARREGGSVFLRRAAVSVTSVTQADYPGGTGTALATTDRYTWLAEGRIELYPASTPYAAQYDAGKLITVVYVPVDDRAKRRAILLELVRITVQRQAYGGWSETKKAHDISKQTTYAPPVSWEQERGRLLRRLEFFST